MALFYRNAVAGAGRANFQEPGGTRLMVCWLHPSLSYSSLLFAFKKPVKNVKFTLSSLDFLQGPSFEDLGLHFTRLMFAFVTLLLGYSVSWQLGNFP